MPANLMKNLREKERLFVVAIRAGKSGTQAAIAAGYSARSAAQTASHLRRKPNVRAAIEAEIQSKAAVIVTEQDRILNRLRDYTFSSMADFLTINDDGLPILDLSNATPEQLATLKTATTKVREIYNGRGDHVATERSAKVERVDPLRSLELLARHHGMLKEQVEHQVTDVASRIVEARLRRVGGGRGDEAAEQRGEEENDGFFEA